MTILRHPLAQFLVAALLLLAGVVVASTVLIGRAAEQEALADARSVTWILGHSVAEPAVPRGLAGGSAGAADKFDRSVGGRLVTGDIRRIKVWSARGQIVYSDATRLIGEHFELDGDEREVLREGGTDAEVSDLGQPENRFERGSGGLVEVYTQIESPEGEPLLFEAYFSDADVEQRKDEVFAPFQRIAVGGLVLLLALASPVIWVLARRVTRAAADRERLLQRSVEASAAERRRIARDLHDGVVQDLAGSTFTVAAVARDSATPEPTRLALSRVAASMRETQGALRSLLVEIHPPDLGPGDLASALEDLTAPAVAAGLDTRISVEGVSGARQSSVALVWRAAQEAVRNTVRHADARTLDVRVRGTATTLELEVRDDGSGFDPAAPTDGDRFGLRGLTSLAVDAGGRVEVRAEPGSGTTVWLEVPR